jgi:hypothetical protein
MECEVVGWSHLAYVIGSSGGNAYSGSIKDGEFLGRLGDYQLVKEVSTQLRT